MSTETLLLELGTEELPPGSVNALADGLALSLSQALTEQRLPHGLVTRYATPRRLAVVIENVTVKADNQTVESFGPPADRAKDDQGNWTQAALGFARKHGVAPDELDIADTDKGPRLAHRHEAEGAKVGEVIADVLPKALRELPMPKRMRWGASREEFLRPVHWLVALLGDSVVPCQALGLHADRLTQGHRFHAPEPISLSHARDYESALLSARVLANPEARREKIQQQVTSEAEKLGAYAVITPALLEEVTALVEWPVTLTGSFEERFLQVPQEALISAMAEHQKYFHVVDDGGNLLPHFIFVSNIESRDPAQVVDGNERVIRPRLADAAFFYESDKNVPLDDRVEGLARIVFQQRLGTLLDKTNRVQALAASFATDLDADVELVRRAAWLGKADLNTALVGEFSDLQGVAGRYYALSANEDPAVADALQQQYWPAFAGDRLPESPVATALALADRLDTVTGIFGIGQTPTGSKDPFALRRAALGVLRILIEKSLSLDLQRCIERAVQGYAEGLLAPDTAEQVLNYTLERLRALYEDADIPAEIYMSVSAKGLTVPVDIDARVKAVHAFSTLKEASSLAAANKRVSNLLEKEGFNHSFSQLSEDLLKEPAERHLAEALQTQQPLFDAEMANGRYGDALRNLAVLQAPVDHFFDDVMVMVDDSALRNNRLALLAKLRALFLQVADISLLVPAK